LASSSAANQDQHDSPVHAWDDDGPSFSDILDVINPLQHIPIVNTIYRHLTGDTEGAVADVAGGALYGGFIGLGLSLASLVTEDATGSDPGDYVYARLFGEDDQASSIAHNGHKGGDKAAAETVASDDAPPPPAASPRDVITTSDAGTANGPVKAGDYLVFGGSSAGSTLPQAAVLPRQAAAAASAPQTAAMPTTKQVVMTTAGAGTRQGDYLVFGGSTPSAPAAAVQQAAPGPSVTAEADATAEASPIQNTLQQAARKEGRLMPLPTRRAPSTPSANLPLPTTGPAAVGGKSQAKLWPGTTASATAPTNDWFADTVNRNMDKYDSLHATSSYGAAAQTGAAASTMSIN
jgi:hypothetical protein